MVVSKEPTRFENVIKSSNDKREYRGLILQNEIKVLIISDPTTDKSAASLDVKVGQLSDPVELPGLAHFCEHMLFLGTAKYPETNDYSQYLSQNGGTSNAATDFDHTNYYFDVNPENLIGALDRFSQFFLCPLFTESMTEKEINAVHMEHEKNLANDGWRLAQLDRASADPNHAYAKFGTGNKETLFLIPKENNIDVRQELLKFYSTWYSANIMSLCVLGKESLDDLEQIVVQMFSNIENKNVEAPIWTEHPFKEEHFKTKHSVVPVKDLRTLSIIFPVPDLQEHYRAAPLRYWSHLLGHEGKGSLLSALKEKGWCNTLMSGRRQAARGFDFYGVDADLSEEGLLHVDDIINMTFQYINMVKKEGPVEWIFREYRDMEKMNFTFCEDSSPSDYVEAICTSLQKYPIEEVLCASKLTSEWRPDLINEVATYLKPENIRVHVLAKAFEKEADSVEPWYGTKYKKERFPDELVARWSNAGTNEALHLPERNEFIPNKFDIKPHDKVDKFPMIIEDNPLFRVWFKQDDEFLYPKATMTFDFVSPLANIDPLSSNMTEMFIMLLTDSLNEYAYNADLAGLKWELSTSNYGLRLALDGYDDKLDILLEKILNGMVNFNVDEKRFEILKEEHILSLKNFEAEEPYEQVFYYLGMLLSEQVWVKEELLNATSMLTPERLKQFVPMLMSKMHIECLIHGNLTKPEALKTIKMVEAKLTSSVKDLTPLLPRQLVLHRELELPNGCHYVYEVENKHCKSSCTLVYYQTGMCSTESNMLLELSAQIISEPCFNVLRTEEQLGYIIDSGPRQQNGYQGLTVLIQSNRHPQYVEGRIDAFMESMQEHIANMSEEEFDMYKESLATQRLEKPKKMNSQSKIYWNEISTQQYNFDRANIEVTYMRTITKQQILDFFKDVVRYDSSRRHKLCIHVVSTAEGGAASQEDNLTNGDVFEKSVASRIDDILQFKTSHPLYPLVRPFNSVPRKGTRQQSKL